MSRNYFLAKGGKTVGPFSQTEIEKMRLSGKYEEYTWVWDETVSRWEAIDPAPLPPSVSANATSNQATAPVAPQRDRRSHSFAAQQIQAVCFNHLTALSGSLDQVTDAGCEFSTQMGSTEPEFQVQLPISLHLYDTKTSRSMKVMGRVGRVERRDGRWHYRIHWKNCPELISLQSA